MEMNVKTMEQIEKTTNSDAAEAAPAHPVTSGAKTESKAKANESVINAVQAKDEAVKELKAAEEPVINLLKATEEPVKKVIKTSSELASEVIAEVKANVEPPKELKVEVKAKAEPAKTVKAVKQELKAEVKASKEPVKNKVRATVAEPVKAVKASEEPVKKAVRIIEEENEAEAEELPEPPSKNEVETASGFNFAPKTFLQPYTLLLLRDWSMHGYEVWERLMVMVPGFGQGDRATVYRTLRQLEREGKVKSIWDTNTEGPAKRVYSLTSAGEEFLKIWAQGLDQYRQTLDFFFKAYTGGMLPSPFSFNPFAGGKRDNKNNK